MLKNYITVAFRNLVRNKLYSAISIVGLSVGITCCLLIFLFVQHELSFDSFHANADNIYRAIRFEATLGELSEGTVSTSFLLRRELLETFPEVERSTIVTGREAVVTYSDQSFTETVAYVDPDFFSMFSFPLLQGDAASVLSGPESVVMTPEMAQKYFGDQEPVGKTVSIQLGETSLEFLVSGIIEKAPPNSSIRCDFLVLTDLLKYSFHEDVFTTYSLILFSTYVQVAPETDIASLEKTISRHVNSVVAAEGDTYELTYHLQPLSEVHHNPALGGEMIPSSDPVTSYILAAIAAAVLLIACINFTTLSIGRSGSRAREIGLRKVLGAERFQIMKQFWGEAFLLSAVAAVVGVGLAEWLLPTFNELAQRQLTIAVFSNVSVWGTLVALIVATALVAGFYPAVLLSKLLPVSTFRGAAKTGGKSRLIQGLVTFQFAVSVFLIVSMLVISSQLDYISSADLGYNTDQVVTFPTGTRGEESANLLERFRTKLATTPEVVDIAGYAYAFGQSWLYINLSGEDGATMLIGEDVTGPAYSATAADLETYFYINWVDPHYISTMGISLIEGRDFIAGAPSDLDGAIIINEAAARHFELDHPVGKKLPKGFGSATIVGVVEDFHYYPLHREIEPLVLHQPRTDNLTSISEIAVRIRSEDISATLGLLERTWTEITGGWPFFYEFLDDRVTGQYRAERRWRRIVQFSSVVSILITCLGLFGLSSLAVSRRIKEVGIRKVLGASEAGIVRLISWKFIVFVLIAIVTAGPIALYVMDSWLDRFAYRTEIGFGIPAVAGCLTLVIALATVGYYAIKAARANPVEALRYE